MSRSSMVCAVRILLTVHERSSVRACIRVVPVCGGGGATAAEVK